jgi:peroxiredoxin
MNLILLISRLVLAAVFGVAGVAKLFDYVGSRKSLADFGVPGFLAAPLAVLLPLAELTCAVAFLPDSSVWWAARGVIVLLALFIVGIGISLARGRTPNCHCFGQLSSSPVSWKTVARNAVLLVPAVLLAAEGRENPGGLPSFAGWTAFESAAVAVAAALAAIVGVTLWLLVHVMHQSGRLLVRLEAVEKKVGIDPAAAAVSGLPVETPAPAFQVKNLDGETVTLDMLREKSKRLLLVFTAPSCTACEELLPEVGVWQREHSEKVLTVLISQGDAEPNRAKAATHNLLDVLLETGQEVSHAYLVDATPGAVLVTDGKIAEPLAIGPKAIRGLMDRALLPTPVKKGERVPAMELPDLDGKRVNLASIRGRRTMLLFWNPSCPYCKGMLEDVKNLEKKPPANAPELLVISSGTPEANRAEGFRAPVLLDGIFGAGVAFGAGGTPSALVIDEDGKVASDVAVGAPNVLALARRRS